MMKWDLGIWAHMRSLWKARSEPESLQRLANMYWYTLLVVALGIVVGATVYGGSSFFEVLRGGDSETIILPSSGGGILFNKKEFDATLEAFASRQEQYESLKDTPPSIADPSR